MAAGAKNPDAKTTADPPRQKQAGCDEYKLQPRYSRTFHGSATSRKQEIRRCESSMRIEHLFQTAEGRRTPGKDPLLGWAAA